MAWRAANSLLVLHQQLQAGAPRAAPPATSPDEWGLIGDQAHAPTSDHAPHDFPGWGNNIVTAADFPNRPDLGLNAHKVLDDIRRSHDARVKYAISNGQMYSSYAVKGYDAWTWRPYNPGSGGDYHYSHGHMSVVGDARADGTQPWQTIGANIIRGDDDDMGNSFGPVQILPAEQGATSLAIPPVQAGIADPRQVWLNLGADMNGGRAAVRIWASNGGRPASWRAVDAGGSKDGLHVIESGEILSIQLVQGDRLLSITRWALDAGGQPVPPGTLDATPPYNGSLSACFERM